MEIYFYIIPVICETGRNIFICMMLVIIGDKTFFGIWLMEIPNWNEQLPKQVLKVLANASMYSKYQSLHYYDNFITNPYINGVTTVFPFLPSPNLKGNDGSDEDNGEDSEDNNHPPARYPNGEDSEDNNHPPARYPCYADCEQRLQTFIQRGWPHESPNPRTLSEAGLFYTGQGDLVRCFHCGYGFKDVGPGADPLRFHARFSPRCHFLCQLIGVPALQMILCSSYFMELYKHQRKSRARYNHPKYADYHTRLESFTGWPSRIGPTQEQLADAGFFYKGRADVVKCFACGGGLRDWMEGDDSWIEHCRWFPNCPYAIHVKGEEYIASIQATVDDMTEEEDNDDDIRSRLEQLTLFDPISQALLNKYKISCLRLGYEEVDFKSTVQELRNRGNAKPSLEDILDLIDIVKVYGQQQTHIPSNETLEETNRRLKSYVKCIHCQKNDTNALFLPCGHLRLCMSCAEPLHCCPVCARDIQNKIKIFMG